MNRQILQQSARQIAQQKYPPLSKHEFEKYAVNSIKNGLKNFTKDSKAYWNYFINSHKYSQLNCGYLINPFISFPAGGAVGGWKELGRTTLGAAGDSIKVTGLTTKRYYTYLVHTKNDAASNIQMALRVGSGLIDAGNNYALRRSSDGGGDSTLTNRSEINQSPGGQNLKFVQGYIANFATKEKLIMEHYCDSNSSGAGAAPGRRETVAKWINTANPIDQIEILQTGAGDFSSGDELVILGWDPADTHTDNFWEELATDTLTGADSNVQLTLSTARKYLWIQAYLKPTATLVPWLRFNNVSTGTPYAFRKSDNGETDPAPSTSQNQIVIGTSESIPQLVNIFVINVSANEKLVIAHSVAQNTLGLNAPTRRETVAKHALTGSLITEVDFVSSISSFASDSEFKVWGAD